jgi:hypothetical protein
LGVCIQYKEVLMLDSTLRALVLKFGEDKVQTALDGLKQTDQTWTDGETTITLKAEDIKRIKEEGQANWIKNIRFLMDTLPQTNEQPLARGRELWHKLTGTDSPGIYKKTWKRI